MALVHLDFKSTILGKSTALYAIIPEPSSNDFNNLKVLYLLHGMGDDHTKWIRRTNIEEYVKKYKLVVISAQFEKSFYTNMYNGENYWDFLTKELPNMVNNLFPISPVKKNHFVAGLSMGGYGAIKWALNYPSYFNSVASFSGVLDLKKFFEIKDENILHKLNLKESNDDFKKIGRSIINPCVSLNKSSGDLRFMLTKLIKEGITIPEIYQYCGKQDPIIEFNVKFKNMAQNFAKNGKLKFRYEEKNGEHNWNYWDYCIKKFLLEISEDLKN